MAHATELFIASTDEIRDAANSGRIRIDVSELTEGDLILFSVADLRREFFLRVDPKAKQREQRAELVKGGVVGALVAKAIDAIFGTVPEPTDAAGQTRSPQPNRRRFFSAMRGREQILRTRLSMRFTTTGEVIFRSLFGRHASPRSMQVLEESVSSVVAAADRLVTEFNSDIDLFLMPGMPSRRPLLGSPGSQVMWNLSLPVKNAEPHSKFVAYWSEPLSLRDSALLGLDGIYFNQDRLSGMFMIGLGFLERFGDAFIEEVFNKQVLEVTWTERSKLRELRSATR